MKKNVGRYVKLFLFVPWDSHKSYDVREVIARLVVLGDTRALIACPVGDRFAPASVLALAQAAGSKEWENHQQKDCRNRKESCGHNGSAPSLGCTFH